MMSASAPSQIQAFTLGVMVKGTTLSRGVFGAGSRT